MGNNQSRVVRVIVFGGRIRKRRGRGVNFDTMYRNEQPMSIQNEHLDLNCCLF
jgi:hypothetical protein